MSKKELQKKLIEFQILEANLKALQERAEIVSQKLEDLQKTRIAIEELKTTKPNKALIPLGSGNFVYGSIESHEDVIVGVGGNVAIKKKRKDALKILEGRMEELQKNFKDISKQSSVFMIQLKKIQQEIEKLQK